MTEYIVEGRVFTDEALAVAFAERLVDECERDIEITRRMPGIGGRLPHRLVRFIEPSRVPTSIMDRR